MKKFKSIFALACSALLISVSVVGCGGNTPATGNGEGSDSSANWPSRLAVATGGTTGVYFPLGGAFANIISENIEGVSANAESTGASVENVNLLNNGDVDFAMVQNDISYYGFNGVEMFDDQAAMTNLRGLASLYPETIQIVAKSDSGIMSVQDLVGKRVAVGAPGSGTEANARQILEAHGISYDDITPDYLSFGEAADGLKDGNVQAAFVTAGTPTAAITDLATTHGVTIVPILPDVAAALIADYPYYADVVIPAGTYKDQNEDIPSVAVMAMLAVNADLDEDLVYEITKALFENLGSLASAHARGADVTLEGALEGMSLEIHPGAQRYYDEVN